jgi:flagellar hook protein FlgE
VLQNVAQQFTQGNLEFTDNSLDLAISGEGFFTLSPELGSGELVYTRAGEFGVDKDGYIVSNEGWYLRSYEVNSDGDVTNSSINSTVPIQLPPSVGAPEATTNLDLTLNLSSNLPGIDDGAGGILAIDPTDTDTFSYNTSATVYDSLGNAHDLDIYFQHIDPAADTPDVGDNQWQVSIYIDGGDLNGGTAGTATALATGIRASYNSDGSLASLDANPATAGIDPVALTFTDGGANEWASGAGTQSVAFTLGSSTQNSGNSAVASIVTNGFPTGRLTGVDISDVGLVRATYSNGQAVPIGKIALGTFANSQALNKIGNTAWKETTDSGQVVAGEAGTGSFGQIQAGALESSNVDLTRELVGLITAQRNFQANSKAIETNNAITQTIINLR